MELIENPRLRHEILNLLQQEYLVKKPMPHLTELVYCLTRSYYERMQPVPQTDKEIILFASGWGLERLLLAGERKLEYGCIDGIHYSPDFLAFTELPGELKTTRMSHKRIVQEGLPEGWKRQILGYMHCLGVTEYELGIMFLIQADIVGFRVVATEDEIAENWTMLTTRAAIYLSHIQMEIAPLPYQWCMENECKFGGGCRYNIKCEVEATKGGASL